MNRFRHLWFAIPGLVCLNLFYRIEHKYPSITEPTLCDQLCPCMVPVYLKWYNPRCPDMINHWIWHPRCNPFYYKKHGD